jgi:hypothetical protein
MAKLKFKEGDQIAWMTAGRIFVGVVVERSPSWAGLLHVKAHGNDFVEAIQEANAWQPTQSDVLFAIAGALR